MITSAQAGYRCHTCSAEFAQWAPAERHADAHGGARIDLILRSELTPTDKGGQMTRSSNRKLRRDGEGRLAPPRPSLKASDPLPAAPALPPTKKTKRGTR